MKKKNFEQSADLAIIDQVTEAESLKTVGGSNDRVAVSGSVTREPNGAVSGSVGVVINL
jgi:hypothetical protein